MPAVVLAGVGHFPQDEVPNLIAAMLDLFVAECAVEEDEAGVGPGACRGAADEEGPFTLRGLMAAAELDAKV